MLALFLANLPAIVSAGALVFGGWLARKVATPKAHDRAATLAYIASGAAAGAVVAMPGSTWAKLFEDTVKQIAAAAGLPTTNRAAINREAARALLELGIKPDSR